ncbi:YhgE/Pip family protein [Bacillus sp. V59.32b]|uniref:YhgE/Pip family protein n=1 Tax=Bacillus sp. V59.32b TaxID=1758642 RepID=UPI000E3B7688|nr:YhgE/Pip domain-containing protein [Bacillus sp. V59.32b]RFU66830.1 YhgE/Pip domain-containing protein [Bacillus sp. V59.32b]
MKGLGLRTGRLGDRKGFLIAIIAALLVPLVYAVIILTADWGPYDNLDSLPVAVVNNDVGGMSGEEEINVGDDLVADLKENKTLGWDFVDSKEAERGMQNNDYYMVIEIPEDFSQKVTTVMDENPEKPELKFTQNEGLHFMAAQVTNNATERIRSQLADKITETYTENVFNSLGDVATGFQDGADGAGKINEGATELHDGTGQILGSLKEKAPDIDRLADGTQKLADGSGVLLKSLQGGSGSISKLADGAARVDDGANKLAAGTGQLEAGSAEVLAGLKRAEAGSNKLNAGFTDKLIPGSEALANGTVEADDGAQYLKGGAQQVADGIEEMAKDPLFAAFFTHHPDGIRLREGSKAVAAGAADLAVGTTNLKDGAQSLYTGISGDAADGAKDLASGLDQLVAGQTEINAGAKELNSGANTLASGTGQLADGNAQVNSSWGRLTEGAATINGGLKEVNTGNQTVKTGWGTLTDGVTKVDDGVGQIENGSKELSTGLAGGAEETGNINTGDDNLSQFASPVQLAGETLNKFPEYRYANAPYIMSLALFVGVLILSLLFDLAKPAVTAVSPFRWYLGKFGTMAGLATAQALLVSFFATFFLKSNFANGFTLVLFSVFVSLTFLTIVFFLVALAGNIGRFIAFAFLVLQLSTTGSALPIHMLPDNLQALSKFLPLTYSIGGFKSIITLDHYGAFWANVGALFVFLAVFAGLTLAYVLFRSNKRVNQTEAAA